MCIRGRFLRADNVTDYCDKQKPTTKELYKTMTDEITGNIVENRGQNRKIANWLKWSYILFMVSIIVLVFNFILLLSILK